MTAREEILGRIGPAGPAAPRPSVSAAVVRPHDEVVDQFAEYAAEYRARVQRVDAEGLAEAVGRCLDGSAVIPADLPAAWVPEGVMVTRDEGLSHAELDTMAVVITGCRAGIAETGTIVLDAGAYQGRRAITLIPDHHVCVVFEAQVVDGVTEAVDMLSDAVAAGRPLTWISGPSATSDIELTRVEGVHGPRRLDILIVHG